MVASAGPAVCRSKWLEDHQWLIEFDGPFEGALEREVPRKSAGRGHPIKNEIAIAGGAVVTQSTDACVRNGRVHAREVPPMHP